MGMVIHKGREIGESQKTKATFIQALMEGGRHDWRNQFVNPSGRNTIIMGALRGFFFLSVPCGMQNFLNQGQPPPHNH